MLIAPEDTPASVRNAPSFNDDVAVALLFNSRLIDLLAVEPPILRDVGLDELKEISKLIKYVKPILWKSNIYGKELAKDSGMILW